jgi:hypothetical protein
MVNAHWGDFRNSLRIGWHNAFPQESKIVSDRSPLLRSWNVNLALKSMNRAGFTLQPMRCLVGNVVQSEAIQL